MPRDPVLLDGVRALLAERDAHVRALERILDAARAPRVVGRLAVLPLVDPLVLDGLDVRAALVQDALAVDDAALGRVGAVGEDQAADGHVGGAGADEGDLDVVDAPADHLESVDEAGERDARGALLVVVPHGDLALLAQGVEDAEALGLGDVFEVHAAQPGLHELDELDELVRVLRVDHEREAVDAAEVLVEEALALHHRHAGLGADVAHAEHAGAVADHGHGVPLVGVLVDLLGVVLDLEARRRDAGGVPDAEVLEVADAALERGLDLAPVEGMKDLGVLHGLIGLRREFLDGRLLLALRLGLCSLGGLVRHVPLLVTGDRAPGRDDARTRDDACLEHRTLASAGEGDNVPDGRSRRAAPGPKGQPPPASGARWQCVCRAAGAAPSFSAPRPPARACRARPDTG